MLIGISIERKRFLRAIRGKIVSIVYILYIVSLLYASKKAFVKGIFLFQIKNKPLPPETFSILSRS